MTISAEDCLLERWFDRLTYAREIEPRPSCRLDPGLVVRTPPFSTFQKASPLMLLCVLAIQNLEAVADSKRQVEVQESFSAED